MQSYIKAISYYLPEKVLTNEELVREFPEWTVEKVAAKVGVEERHVAAAGETAADMLGNLMIDSLVEQLPRAQLTELKFELLNRQKKIELEVDFQEKQYGVMTFHRPGNVDDKDSLTQLVNIWGEISNMVPLIFPVHPRTYKNIQQFGLQEVINSYPQLYFIEPLGYMAANMMTFTPIAKLNISLGNSIIYAESSVHATYFIPIGFYKSMDHTLTKGAKIENQNSQVYFNISSRNINHLHLYASLFFDEVEMSRFKPSSKERNPVSYKLGFNLTGLPVQDLSLTGEFTRSNILTYKHSIPALTYASNGYNLGSYLGDNSQEIYLSLRYKPIRGLLLNLSYLNAEHGNEYSYIRQGHIVSNVISQPSLGDVIWSNSTFGLKATYELMNNTYAVINVQSSNIKGHDARDSFRTEQTH